MQNPWTATMDPMYGDPNSSVFRVSAAMDPNLGSNHVSTQSHVSDSNGLPLPQQQQGTAQSNMTQHGGARPKEGPNDSRKEKPFSKEN